MKRFIVCSIVLMAMFASPNVAEAQLKRLLKEKALEALKGKQTEETTTEKERQPEKQQQTSPNFLERRMMQAMGLNNVKYEPRYSFTSSMVMDIENIDSSSNSETMQYTTYFDAQSKSYAMVFDDVNKETGQAQKGTMIFDMVNQAMLILSNENGQLSGVAISIGNDSIPNLQEGMEDVDAEDVEEAFFVNPMYRPTGKSKTIAGINCHEYIYENTEGRVTMWVSKKSPIDLSRAYGQMYGLQGLATASMGFGTGMVMEMISEDFMSGEKVTMHVSEINNNTNKMLDISGYQIVGMAAGQ